MSEIHPTWAVATRAARGETASGDGHRVDVFAGGAFVAVVDALGHGEASARTAQATLAALEDHQERDLDELVRRCHERIRATRGATLGVMRLDWQRQQMAWLGVGNVSGVHVHADTWRPAALTPLMARAGVVGDHLPPATQPMVRAISAGDLLVLATDGIRADFLNCLAAPGTPRQIADRILRDCAVCEDDALVLVLRCPFVQGQP